MNCKQCKNFMQVKTPIRQMICLCEEIMYKRDSWWNKTTSYEDGADVNCEGFADQEELNHQEEVKEGLESNLSEGTEGVTDVI